MNQEQAHSLVIRLNEEIFDEVAGHLAEELIGDVLPDFSFVTNGMYNQILVNGEYPVWCSESDGHLYHEDTEEEYSFEEYRQFIIGRYRDRLRTQLETLEKL